MRNAFAEAITEVASRDKRFVLLSGDIGNQLFDRYKEAVPERFFNCGVAEQSTIGIASGLALTGLRPVAYTITPFISYRCFEQIRIDVCYHNAPVAIVGVGSGMSYASLGATHHSCEDIALLRTLPGMTVVCPCDQHEVRAVIRALPDFSGPIYIRIGKKGEPIVHSAPPALTIGKAIKLEAGNDITLLVCGHIMPEAQKAAVALRARGISVELFSFHTVKPLDTETLREAFTTKNLVVTIEEHSRIGGLGSAIAEWLTDEPRYPARLLRLGTPDSFLHEAGEHSYARKAFGIDAISIENAIMHRLETV
jgi:transketolase